MTNKKKSVLQDKYNESKWLIYEEDIIKYYAQKILDWQDNPNRYPPNIAFTEGLGRFIAQVCERYSLINNTESYMKGWNDLVDKINNKVNINYEEYCE